MERLTHSPVCIRTKCRDLLRVDCAFAIYCRRMHFDPRVVWSRDPKMEDIDLRTNAEASEFCNKYEPKEVLGR